MSRYRNRTRKAAVRWSGHLSVDLDRAADHVAEITKDELIRNIENGRQSDGKTQPRLSKSYKKRLRQAGQDTKKNIELTGGLKASIRELARMKKKDSIVIRVGPDGRSSNKTRLSSAGMRIVGTGLPYASLALILGATRRSVYRLGKRSLEKLAARIEHELRFRLSRRR